MLGHKEWRFIVYVVPLYNVAGARGCFWMYVVLFFFLTSGFRARFSVFFLSAVFDAPFFLERLFSSFIRVFHVIPLSSQPLPFSH